MSVCFPLVSTCLWWFDCKSLERIKGQWAEEVFREQGTVMNPWKEVLVGETRSLESLITAFFMLGLVDRQCYFVLGSITDAAQRSYCEALLFRESCWERKRENGQNKSKNLRGRVCCAFLHHWYNIVFNIWSKKSSRLNLVDSFNCSCLSIRIFLHN